MVQALSLLLNSFPLQFLSDSLLRGSSFSPSLPIARAKDSQSQDGSVGAAVTPIITKAATAIFPDTKSVSGLPDVCGSSEKDGQKCHSLDCLWF